MSVISDAARGRGKPHVWDSLRSRAFRVLIIAAIASYIGTWSHDIAISWSMTSLTTNATLVALLTTATMLPLFLFGLPAGALADIVDRRNVLIASQLIGAATAATLSYLAYTHALTVVVLLLGAFVVGVALAIAAPAWNSSIPEMVEPRQLEGAVTLEGLSTNIARMVGPALAGFIVGTLGTHIAFAFDAVTFLLFAAALVWWPHRDKRTPMRSERFWSGLVLGMRHVRHSPPMRRVVLRYVVFMLAASAFIALLPVVARQRLGFSPMQFGITYAFFGVGALLGVVALDKLGSRATPNGVTLAATSVYVIALVGAALATGPLSLWPAAGLAGAGWLATVATHAGVAQSAAPSWVRGRALAATLIAFQGTMAIAAWGWGAIAEAYDVRLALLGASGVQLASLAVVLALPLSAVHESVRTPSGHWPALPPLGDELHDAAALVTVEYRVRERASDEFLLLMRELRRERLRDGAIEWRIVRAIEEPHAWLETFYLPSWREHERQHGRVTQADRALQEAIAATLDAGTGPVVRHYVAASDAD